MVFSVNEGPRFIKSRALLNSSTPNNPVFSGSSLRNNVESACGPFISILHGCRMTTHWAKHCGTWTNHNFSFWKLFMSSSTAENGSSVRKKGAAGLKDAHLSLRTFIDSLKASTSLSLFAASERSCGTRVNGFRRRRAWSKLLWNITNCRLRQSIKATHKVKCQLVIAPCPLTRKL